MLKQEATKLGIPIIALSQLSRRHMIEGREPALNDLRDSGALEQDADTVLFLYATNQERKHKVQTRTKGILAKQREGSIGDFFMLNNKTIQKFDEIPEIEYRKNQRSNKQEEDIEEDTSMPF